MTAAEVIAVSTNQLFDANYASALVKLNQILDNVLWWTLCDCPGGFASSAPLFPPAPVGAPAAVVAPAALPAFCVTANFPLTGSPALSETSVGALDVTSQLVPSLGPSSVVMDVGGRNTLAYPIPTPYPTSARVTLQWPNTNERLQVAFWWGVVGNYGTNGTLSLTSTSTGAGQIDSGPIALPAAKTLFAVTLAADSAFAATQPGTVCLQFQAPGSPATSACCPPDPQLLGVLNEILTTVTAHQRYRSPFAYVVGAAHSGVTGSVSTAVSQLLGIRIAVTAFPASTPILGGNPSYLMNLGWVSISDANGILQEKRLTQVNTEWLPEAMQLATSFNLFLSPGVTATWSELQAET